MSENIKKYFEEIDSDVNYTYSIAKVSREKGYDPVEKVEIVLAKNMAERIEGLIGVVAPQIVGKGIPKRIEELEKQFGKLDWRVALTIALEVAKEKFCNFNGKIEAMEIGIRVGIAYVTNGVVASPLEGFTNLKVRKRRDGKEYLAVFFSGPIRSAGGTGASVSVIIADYIRKQMGYSRYDSDEKEVKRYCTELVDYHERITNLQYFPSDKETEFISDNLPIQVDGDPSEDREVSNYKDLNRVETNYIRSGMCLVMGEGLASKAPKLWKQLQKWGKDFNLEDWNFLEKFINLQKKIKSEGKSADEDLIKKDYTFIKDLVAGRPILTYPMRKGGFRLRYGRSRNTGLSSLAIHPLTMKVLDGFIAVGTQLKIERPSKGTALGSCDSIEGPIVKLKNGNVLFVDENSYEEIKNDIEEILFLGDILVPYGDFFNRAHALVTPGYCEEWWFNELKSKCKMSEDLSILSKVDLPLIKKLFKDPLRNYLSAENSFKISKSLEIPLHPKYTYHWNDLDDIKFLALLDWLNKSVIKKEEYYKIIFPLTYELEDENIKLKRILEELGIPHNVVSKEHLIIEDDWAIGFMIALGFYEKNLNLKKIVSEVGKKKNVLEIINSFSELKIKDKSGIFIGARMGRPEKAKMRKMTGSPHGLFPVGSEGGRLRSFQSSLEHKNITADFPIYYCKTCKISAIYTSCPNCGNKTQKKFYCIDCDKTYDDVCKLKKRLNDKEILHRCVRYKLQSINIVDYFSDIKKKIGLKELPPLIKGVRGTSNKNHTPENLAKAILRSAHNIYVNKDGTVRYDMTQLPLTHFRPIEIRTSIERLKELGYVKDISGEELVNDEQILELKPQDVILPSCKESFEDGADVVFYKVACFIDDLLVKLYHQEKFYNLKSEGDLVGHKIIGLAPHTSAGIVGRIIGFSNTQGCYAHPLWHSAERRDCDGDEIGTMLLMDGLLNFSREFLPAHRGATQDAPLILTTVLIPSEVDDMVFDMDVVWEYPLYFYQACEQNKMPWDIKIEQLSDNLSNEKQFEKWGFTHDTKNINYGAVFSKYKSLPTMQEKVLGQMKLAEKIRAVDTSDVARLIIEKHFIRDIKGNLRKFSMQKFRCSNCNEKYRRPLLLGKCLKCGGRIIFTVSEGSVIKYLTPSLDLAKKYNLPPYIQQTLELTKDRIESVFGRDPEKQEGLQRWF